jgi:sporulation protein YlmC with PRC-barrel domain
LIVFCVTSVSTASVVPAGKVRGTRVYGLAGEELGTVDDIMIDRISGRAIFVVISCGGLLGMGGKCHALPWATLNFDDEKGRYVIIQGRKRLQEAPVYERGRGVSTISDSGPAFDSHRF